MEQPNKEIYKEGFEEQFAKKELFDVLDGKIEAVDVVPDTLKTETPLLLAPGWAASSETFKDSIKILFEKNRRVISLEHASEGVSEDLMDEHLKQQYPADELRKAMALLALIKEKNIDKIDVITHSEGAINTAIAASLEPEKFRNIVFMAPGGMIGKDTFPKLAGRFSYGLIRDAIKNNFSEDFDKARGARAMKVAIKYMASNPKRALKESVAISSSQIHEIIKELHSKGIGIAIASGVDDPAFPMDKMQETAKADQLDGFVSLKGSHNEIIDRPEKYVAAADELLDKLEKKKNSQNQDSVQESDNN